MLNFHYPIAVSLLLTLILPLAAGLPSNVNFERDPNGVLSFEDFAPEASTIATSAPDRQQWYKIEVGNGYFESEPPGEAFIVNELPGSMEQKTTMIKANILTNKKYRYADQMTVTHDPLGRKLGQPFSLGKTLYTYVISDNPNAIQLSIYYYDSGDVKWKNNNTPEPSEYTLDFIEIKQENALMHAGKWLVQVSDQKTEEYIEEGERKKRLLYRYAFFRITRI